jgi:hypothetical protein
MNGVGQGFDAPSTFDSVLFKPNRSATVGVEVFESEVVSDDGVIDFFWDNSGSSWHKRAASAGTPIVVIIISKVK